MNEKLVGSLIFLCLFVEVVIGPNCSVYDPCSSYGYCIDDQTGEWQCECKFWWSGKLCDEQSSSGIQVIVLGAITCVFIFFFHGLVFICRFLKKKTTQENQQNQTESIKTNQINPHLQEIAVIHVKQYKNHWSILTFLLLILTSAGAVVGIWSLLQTIHNELVHQYLSNNLLFYNRSSICNAIDANGYNLLTLPVACFIILLFTIYSKRISCMRGKWKGFIAPPVPLDFYNHIHRQLAVVVFTVVADELLHILNEIINGNTSKAEGVVLLYLSRILTVLIIGLRYYPILAAVHINTKFSLIFGTLYAWLDFSTSVIYLGSCQSDYYPSDDNFDATNGTDLVRLFEYYGTGQNLIIIQLCALIPRYLCWSYIVIKLPMLLMKKITGKYSFETNGQYQDLSLTREEKCFLHSSSIHSTESRYIRNLFRPIEQRTNTHSLIGRLIPKFIYQWRDDFRFSSRILCIYGSVFLLLYYMTIQFIFLIIPWLDGLHSVLQSVFDGISSSFMSSSQENFHVPNLIRSYVLCILTALLVTLIQMFVLLANIRRNLFQIQRGDDSEIPKRDPSKYISYGTGNFNFAGYYIGYIIWGYLLLAFFSFLIYVIIDSFIIYGSSRLMEKILRKIIPIILLILFKQYINKILARYVFLQDYGETLAINNRRILLIFLYFNFFLDAFLGFISSIIRIVKSIVGACLYMCRLDYSPLGRKLEFLDPGFSAYCGFIQMEAIHRNPILLGFSSYLYGRMKIKQYVMQKIEILNPIARQDKRRSTKYIHKWYLLVLIIRNPTLKLARKNYLQKIKEEKEKIIQKNLRQQINSQPLETVSEMNLRNLSKTT